MYLKRVYKDGKLSHLKVLRAPKVQKFPVDTVMRMTAQGVFSLGEGKITLKTAEGEPDVVYKIVSGPGHYCCHCNKPMTDSNEAKNHVESEHKGEESPDPNNPSGYRQDNTYTCVLNDENLTAEDAERFVQDQRKVAATRYSKKYKRAPEVQPPPTQPAAEPQPKPAVMPHRKRHQ